jgi:hypothetical protein
METSDPNCELSYLLRYSSSCGHQEKVTRSLLKEY